MSRQRIVAAREQVALFHHADGALRWRNSSGLVVAPGQAHSYLIDPPINYPPDSAAHRATFGRPDQHLLFTLPNENPPDRWQFHSPHDSLEQAQAAAETHNGAS